MFEWVELHMWGAERLQRRASFKYELIERMARSARRAGVVVLAFGLSDQVLRVLIDGSEEARANLLRGLKVGTIRRARALGHRLLFVETVRSVVDGDLVGVVARTHRTPLAGPWEGPLESPWSSHRDLLEFRKSSYFDSAPLRRLVDPLAAHRAAGGGELPAGWPPDESPPSLELIMRVSAAVVGAVPADSTCFPLFVGVAREHGYRSRAIASALNVSTRRVRQLGTTVDDRAVMVDTCLADPRLRQVP